MASAYVKSRGRLVAEALTGCWRPSPPPLKCSAEELKELTPLLLKSGAAALFWGRVRHSDLRDAPEAQELHQAYRLYVLQYALHQRTIVRVVELLRPAGVEPVFVKGWAATRLYPGIGLRPCGDVDLCVRPGQFHASDAVLAGLQAERQNADLHCGFEKLGGGNFDEIYARSQLIKLGETGVRAPCAEDHLRILCVHMLREGAWRPLWLCDVAAAVESRPPDFDWDHCLGGNRRWSNWVISALRLARQLLGANLEGTPAARSPGPLPRWLVPAILKEWGSLRPSMVQRHLAPMGIYWRRPYGVLEALRNRWPNPVEATVSMRGRFNDLPRLPFQIGDCLARAAKFAARLPRTLRE